jgi:hypothetical protein
MMAAGPQIRKEYVEWGYSFRFILDLHYLGVETAKWPISVTIIAVLHEQQIIAWIDFFVACMSYMSTKALDIAGCLHCTFC